MTVRSAPETGGMACLNCAHYKGRHGGVCAKPRVVRANPMSVAMFWMDQKSKEKARQREKENPFNIDVGPVWLVVKGEMFVSPDFSCADFIKRQAI